MKIPRTRHQKVKQLKPWLSVYQDKRSTNTPKLEGSSGGGGYSYWGTEDKTELRNRIIDRNRRKLDKLAKNVEVEGLVSRLLGRITALKSPEEPSRPDG